MDRLFSLICAMCPVCVVRRRWPASWFARITEKEARICPFCRAYARLHHADTHKGNGTPLLDIKPYNRTTRNEESRHHEGNGTQA